MSSGIYEIRNMVNGHRYIGSAVSLTHRKAQHFYALRRGTHHSLHLQAAYNKYGEENFVFTVLYECSLEDRLRCEQEEIDLLKPEYNHRIVADSNYGSKWSEESRANMCIKMSKEGHPNWGKHLSEEHKKNISRANIGKKHGSWVLSEETKKRMSIAQSGKKMSEEACRNIGNSKRGIKHTEEHNIKIGLAGLGRKDSDETRKKKSLAAKRREDAKRQQRINNVSHTNNS